MKTALISAYHKTDELVAFAEALRSRGWALFASAGTKAFLAQKGIESTDVASMVGPPILGHRVVTLSREIHAGLLARQEDQAELERLGIRRIDLVYVDLYPLEEEISNPEATEESVIEKTDIGGPTLLRAAAKGRRIVLSDQFQIPDVLTYIDAAENDKKFLRGLAAAAEKVAAEYANVSAAYLNTLD